ncbi:LON peptidase substrate-binding domain-containing protein [Roseisolibacter sp. H3M3-2]|uniref:LON peptidase substrate-binding domain-containing protein n=1 Tax=Roseisolibacter sp. H3M3-2 TaxID=3031323 RepID=UPI0023DB0A02|nr:LON peptidase substrate-binding domain-containing protein [Roseisolibacter sp. H3M3-2]MDF1503244.1 LON peptidase substrate-binding domain-containing protein [Roseisolibacter sp. H3M3-2]
MSSPARLPLFPLPLVLFPGAALPLHVFEPRYRALLADCRAGDGRFGIVTGGGEAPRAGAVGCVAELQDVAALSDGRANILVEGGARFVVVRVVAIGTPYFVAETEPVEDVVDAAATLRTLDARVRDAFGRVARAARSLADDSSPLPALPADPGALSFAVAAAVDLGLTAKQRLLASRSAAERLSELDALLTAALPAVERRAEVHAGARSNGSGPHAPPTG